MTTPESFKDELEKELEAKYPLIHRTIKHPALWAAKLALEKAASIANHYMADQTDPSKALAASDIKIRIRQLAKELE